MLACVTFCLLVFLLPENIAIRLNTGILPAEQHQKRIALVVRGEAFRIGGQGSRNVGCDLKSQLDCSQEQMKFILDPLRNEGVEVDVFITTYHTDDARDAGLVKLWKGTAALRFIGWCDHDHATQGRCIRTALNGLDSYMKSTKVDYNLIILIRHDFVPKNKMLADAALQHINDAKVWLAPFKMTHNFRFFEDRVPDTFQIFTSNVLPHMMKIVENGGWPGENIWTTLEGDVGRGHMGFATEYFADSDPGKYMNPMYRFCVRGEGHAADQWVRKRQSLSAEAWGLDRKSLVNFDFASPSNLTPETLEFDTSAERR